MPEISNVMVFLLLYLAPVLAIALLWHAQRLSDGPSSADSVMSWLEGRTMHARAVAWSRTMALAAMVSVPLGN